MLSATVRRAENLQRMGQKGPFRAFAIAWVDEINKFKTNIDENGDTNPVWNTTLRIPLVGPIDDDTSLKIAIFDARNDGKEKRIGSAELKLREVENEVESRERTLTLKRLSFRSRGHVVVELLIEKKPRENERCSSADEVADVATTDISVMDLTQTSGGGEVATTGISVMDLTQTSGAGEVEEEDEEEEDEEEDEEDS